MELEKNTFNALLDYLKAHGYPESSFAIEYPIGRRYRVDLAIVDPKTNLPLQIFEIKSQRNRNQIEFGKEQLKKYLTTLQTIDVPAYLVFPKDDSPFFEIDRVYFETSESQQLRTEEIESYDILNFSTQKQSRLVEKINRSEEEKDIAEKEFRRLCYTLSLGSALLFILLKSLSITLSTMELGILGVSIALVIIPYVSKLKILGVEIERWQKEKNQ
jgi:hypothetical protein